MGKRTEPEEEDAAVQKKKRNKGAGWKRWSEKWTELDEKTATVPYFWTKLGGIRGKYNLIYPQEIQIVLHEALKNVDDAQAQHCEYDMTDRGVYILRLASKNELDEFEKK